MCFARCVVVFLCSGSFGLSLAAAPATHLVTGNGYGFAVVSPKQGTAAKFYAHPYSFSRQDPKKPLSEGIETANFITELGWSEGKGKGASAEYQDESHVIRVHTSAGEGLYFMPFGFAHPALIVSWSSAPAESGSLHVEWKRPVKSRKSVEISGTEVQVLKFDGIEESLLIIPLGSRRPQTAPGQQILATHTAWALVSLEGEDNLKSTASDFNRWRSGLSPEELAKREIAQLEQWRVKPGVQFKGEQERRLWRQSEVILRMAQSREPNRPGRYSNGLIVACLPDGVFFTPWVRDMAYAAVAFARMGHREEARAALRAYFNAQPTGKMRDETAGADYQISVVRYFGDGTEEPFFTMEGSTNIEFDDWGLALWVLGEYMRKYDDSALLEAPTYRGKLYASARNYVAKSLLANLDRYGNGLIVAADTSIWEERQKDKKHFAFSTAVGIVGLRDFAEIAHRAGDEATRTDVLKHVALLEKGFNAAFVRDAKLRGTLEEGIKNDPDGALLAIINFGLVPDPAVVRGTVERMDLLKVASGGYRRVRSIYTDPSIYEFWYERQEFLFVDFSLAEVYRRLGRHTEADAMLRRIVEKSAADNNIIPEMYVAVPCTLFPGEVGDATGATPMVGYGAGVYVLHLLERSQLEGHR
jgi:GH15 family glucan-1,4-alpha-glucosidase